MRNPLEFVFLPVAVRAYTTTENQRERRPDTSFVEPSEWILIFDTETETDAYQQLRFGTYQVRRKNKLVEDGIFDDDHLNVRDLAVLRAVHRSHGGLRSDESRRLHRERLLPLRL